MSSPDNQSPVNPLPPVVLALFLAIFGIELAFLAGEKGLVGGPGAIGWRSAAIQAYAFNSDIFQWMLINGVYPAEYLMRLVAYPFLHGSFTHAIFAGVMLLALGKFVGSAFSQWATLVLFLSSSVAGAVAYGLVAPGHPWLIGAFPGVYGLIGGFTYLIWLKLGQMGEQQSRAFGLIGILLGIQLLFGLLFGVAPDWVADVAGFAFGFTASIVLVPGGWRKLRAKIRRQ